MNNIAEGWRKGYKAFIGKFKNQWLICKASGRNNGWNKAREPIRLICRLKHYQISSGCFLLLKWQEEKLEPTLNEFWTLQQWEKRLEFTSIKNEHRKDSKAMWKVKLIIKNITGHDIIHLFQGLIYHHYREITWGNAWSFSRSTWFLYNIG